MRQKMTKIIVVLYCFLFVLSFFMPAKDDGMVLIYLGLALIGAAALGLATSKPMRIVTWAATVLAIVLALWCWHLAVDQWTSRVKVAEHKLLEWNLAARAATRPAMQP